MATLKPQGGTSVKYMSAKLSGPFKQSNGETKEVMGFLQTVSEGTEGAVRREWSVGKESGVVYEIVHTGIGGYIKDIKLDEEGKYGTEFHLYMSDGEILQFKLKNKIDREMAKALSNIDLDKDISIRPYSYKKNPDDKWDTVGFQIRQEGEKVGTAFYDFDKKEVVGDYPKASFDWKTAKDSEKLAFNESVIDFLTNHIKENVLTKLPIAPREDKSMDEVNGDNDAAATNTLDSEFADDINPEDIPF